MKAATLTVYTSDEIIRARSLRSEADALVRIDEARRVLLHISGLLLDHPGDARLLAEEKAILVDIAMHRAAAREAMKERGDLPAVNASCGDEDRRESGLV